MKHINVFLAVFCASLLLLSFLNAQENLYDWQKEQENAFQKYKQNETQEYEKFKNKQDSAFVEFLKKEWHAMQLMRPLVPDTTPKPVYPTITTLKNIPKENVIEPAKIVSEIIIPSPPVEKKAESIESLLASMKKDGQPITVNFYDTFLSITCDPAVSKPSVKDPLDNTQISNFWSYLCRVKYYDILDQCVILRDRMQLNDWGYCTLLYKLGEQLYRQSPKTIPPFVWFMMIKSGYIAKIGFDETDIYLLLPSQNMMYGLPYFTMDGIKFYLVNFKDRNKTVNSVYSYNGNYPQADKVITLQIKTPPAIRQAVENKQLHFKYDAHDYIIHLDLKLDAIDFYKNYPQTEYSIYFAAALSNEARYSLLRDLRPIIQGKTEVEAVNILLRFVQTAFKYENDEVQFGREKPFFAEETLFYSYSDCEDRAILFAYIVRQLLGLEVIGLDYPGHSTTAVKFSTDVRGDAVEYDGRKYLVCDPTYINANIGKSMPKFVGVKPEIIEIGQ